jgi:hypothetical protein
MKHASHVDPDKSGLAVVVVGTGHMREYLRCAPRLVSAVLKPNNAIMTMTTYPSYTTLGPPLVHFGGPNATKTVELMRRVAAGRASLPRGQRRKSRKELAEMLELVPSVLKRAVTHEQLRETYGDHLALSVMLDSEGLLRLAQESAPGVTFHHFITVLAQWAAIEIAFEKTFHFLRHDASPQWADAFRGGHRDGDGAAASDRIVFLRIRPDVFVIGTSLLFRIQPSARSELPPERQRLELTLECGAEAEAPGRSESPAARYSFAVALDSRTSGSTVWRTPPFPEFTWPMDPLSDFSAVTVGSPSASEATATGHQMWSWVLRRPFPENFSYISPENVTAQFLAASKLNTAEIPFGWHFLLRAPGYQKINRRAMRVPKWLRFNGTRVFRTDDDKFVRCPPVPPPP